LHVKIFSGHDGKPGIQGVHGPIGPIGDRYSQFLFRILINVLNTESIVVATTEMMVCKAQSVQEVSQVYPDPANTAAAPTRTLLVDTTISPKLQSIHRLNRRLQSIHLPTLINHLGVFQQLDQPQFQLFLIPEGHLQPTLSIVNLFLDKFL
jgi:hypothetical protein